MALNVLTSAPEGAEKVLSRDALAFLDDGHGLALFGGEVRRSAAQPDLPSRAGGDGFPGQMQVEKHGLTVNSPEHVRRFEVKVH